MLRIGAFLRLRIVDVAMLSLMARTRISTTVDTAQLERARSMGGCRDSELLDRALVALVDQEERRREMIAFAEHPYESDADLDLPTPDIDWDAELPYDGDVPAAVVERARRRRAARS